MDQREDANNAQVEGMLDDERRRTAATVPTPPGEFDLTTTFDFFGGLYVDSAHASGTEHAPDDGNGRPPGMQLEYRDAEAMQQAEHEEDEEYFRNQAPHQRNRHVDNDGGIRSVRSPPRRPPLLATPIIALSPSPYNAAVPKGPAFSFLNY